MNDNLEFLRLSLEKEKTDKKLLEEYNKELEMSLSKARDLMYSQAELINSLLESLTLKKSTERPPVKSNVDSSSDLPSIVFNSVNDLLNKTYGNYNQTFRR
jgi:aspartyl/asparaginyl-tRNA synthetase